MWILIYTYLIFSTLIYMSIISACLVSNVDIDLKQTAIYCYCWPYFMAYHIISFFIEVVT